MHIVLRDWVKMRGRPQRIFEAVKRQNGESGHRPFWFLPSCVLTKFRDQELRFTVHDSPDYYQLKVSVFAEDKKTDLVGEAWIDLRSIIIPGGGQSDVWQNLTCKGKYAGEIRIEITFYDSRPKPEKPAVKPKQPSPEPQNGSLKQRTPVKRRPLPSDPVGAVVPSETPPTAPSGPDHQTPPRLQNKQSSHSSFVPSQSPLQSVEYNTPPTHTSRNHHPDQHSPSPHTGPPQGYITPTRGDPRQPRLSMDPYEATSRNYEERDFSPQYPNHQLEHIGPRERHYSNLPEAYEAPPPEDPRQFSPMEDERPPPPPAHRSRHNSGSQELVTRNAYDTSPTKTSQLMRQEVLRNEAHRHSISSYPGRPTFRGYDSAPPAPNPLPPPAADYDSSMPRHHSYDQSYDPHHRSMQPTVEDVPEPSAQHPNTYRYSGTRNSWAGEIEYDQDPSPAPLNLSRSPGASPYREELPAQVQHGYQDQNPYQMTVSPLSTRDYSHSPGQVSHLSHSSQSQHSNPRAELEVTHIQSSPNYSLPALPPSLIPGMDPKISQEITDRIYEDRRREKRQNSQAMTAPNRGRQGYDAYQSYVPGQGNSPAYTSQPYERRAITYKNENEQDMQLARTRGVSPDTRTSPNPQQTIRRKSVSPAPPPTEERRLSGIPFGPDDYDALNTSLVVANDKRPPGFDESKIYDIEGREIDPSDHLPMETWAPEPEHKHKEPSPEPRSRPSPAGAQPMPPSTRRTPRSGRPYSHSISSSSQPYMYSDNPHTPPAGGSVGRTRLQKRTNRASIMGPSPGASSPLTPISPDNFQDRQSPYTPTRGLPRASTWDHQNENRAPYGAGPPIPAKIPLPLMSGANGSGTELALMEEMQRIDIGTGRSRRRGGY